MATNTSTLAANAPNAPNAAVTDNSAAPNNSAAPGAAPQFLVCPKNKAARSFVDKLRFNETADITNDAYAVGMFSDAQKNDIVSADAPTETLFGTLTAFLQDSGSGDSASYKFKDPFPSRLQDRVIHALAAVVNHYGTALVDDAVGVAIENAATAPSSNRQSRFDAGAVLAALGLPAHLMLASVREDAEAHLRTRASPAPGADTDDGASADSDTLEPAGAVQSHSFDTASHIREFVRSTLAHRLPVSSPAAASPADGEATHEKKW
jgi:hypothetical protein